MADITFQQLTEAVAVQSPIKTWVDSLPTLPPGVTVSSLISELLLSAALAADTQNRALPPNQRITGYVAPQWQPAQYDGNGNLVVRGRAALDFVKILPVHGAATGPILG